MVAAAPRGEHPEPSASEWSQRIAALRKALRTGVRSAHPPNPRPWLRSRASPIRPHPPDITSWPGLVGSDRFLREAAESGLAGGRGSGGQRCMETVKEEMSEQGKERRM